MVSIKNGLDISSISERVGSLSLYLGNLISNKNNQVQVYEYFSSDNRFSFIYINGPKKGEKELTEDFIVKDLEGKIHFHSSMKGEETILYEFSKGDWQGKIEDIYNRRTFD